MMLRIFIFLGLVLGVNISFGQEKLTSGIQQGVELRDVLIILEGGFDNIQTTVLVNDITVLRNIVLNSDKSLGLTNQGIVLERNESNLLQFNNEIVSKEKAEAIEIKLVLDDKEYSCSCRISDYIGVSLSTGELFCRTSDKMFIYD